MEPIKRVLVLFCGLPGAGKSTLCRSLKVALDSHHPVLISYDELYAPETFEPAAWHASRRQAIAMVEGALAQAGATSILLIDDNLYYRSMRHTFLKLARKYQVGFVCIHLQADLDTALARNSQRTGTACVPEATMRAMHARFESPESDPWSDFIVSLPALLSPAELLQRALSAVQAGFGRIPPPMVVEDTAAAQAQREATLKSLAHQLDIRLRKVMGTLLRTKATSLSAAELSNKKRSFLDRVHRGEVPIDEHAELAQQLDALEKRFESEATVK